jgi:hypothetical protein
MHIKVDQNNTCKVHITILEILIQMFGVLGM